MMSVPNIFNYATSELSQDAFFAWLFKHSVTGEDTAECKIGRDLVKSIITQFNSFGGAHLNIGELSGYHCRIKKQFLKIDILAEFAPKNAATGFWILVEDKVQASESTEKQPEKYREQLKKSRKNLKFLENVIPVLLRTGYATQCEIAGLDRREIVFIGAHQIFDLVKTAVQDLPSSEILSQWFKAFVENRYDPIRKVEELVLAGSENPSELMRSANHKKLDAVALFEKISEYLFHDLKDFERQLYPVSGRGHVDVHCMVCRPGGNLQNQNTAFFLIWNGSELVANIKHQAFDYATKKKRLSNDTFNQVDREKEKIKSSLEFALDPGRWRVTQDYLQMARYENAENESLDLLKSNLASDLTAIDKVIQSSKETSMSGQN